MFTRTSDCMLVSNERASAKEQKTIPAIQLDVKSDNAEFQLCVLAFNFSDPVTRIALEAMYVSASEGLTEEELSTIILNKLPRFAENDNKLIDVLSTIRERRWANIQKPLKLNISDDNLIKMLNYIKFRDNTVVIVGHDLEGFTRVNDLDEINMELLNDIMGDKFKTLYDNISNNEEHVIACGRKFMPEDSFINRKYLRLSTINQMSGGEYYLFETLKKAYTEDPHFSAHPDFFSRTHCDCGAELVIRKNEYNEYTLMSCINPFCFEKMAFCLADFARAMGIDGLGATTLMELTKSVAFNNSYHFGDNQCNYVSCIRRDNDQYLGDAAGVLWNNFIDAIGKYNGTAKDLIMAMSLPYMGEYAGSILSVELLKNQHLTADLLLEESNSKGKRDIKFILNLWLYLEDFRYVVLELAEQLNLNIVEEYFIYITKGVLLELDDGTEVKMTKSKFVDMVNKMLLDSGVTNMRVVLKKSVTHACRALIADVDRHTGNCATAQSYGIPIYTSREFLNTFGGA